MYVTSVARSASGTLFGGMGIAPQAPLPPLLIFCASFAGAVASPAYLAATSLKAGPTSCLSTVWQAAQLYLARSEAASPLASPIAHCIDAQAQAAPQIA